MTTLDAADICGIASLPVETFAAGHRIMAAGSTTGRLLILERGAVAIEKDGVRICEVCEPGAVLGELAALLDRPHTADVLTLEDSAFRVADANAFLHADPAAALYVARVMAQRVDAANSALLGLRCDEDAAAGRGTMGRLIDRLAAALRYDCSDGAFPWYSIIPPGLLAAVNRLPVQVFQPGETVLAAGARTGRLLILEEGSVEVVRDGRRLGNVVVRGAVLGELSALLDRPHSADVRALAPSTFHVADAATFLSSEPAAALYVALLMAKRIDSANRTLVEAKRRLDPALRRSPVAAGLDRIGRSLHHPASSIAAHR